MTFRVDGVSASYSQRRRSFNCGAVLGVCNYRDVGGVEGLRPRQAPDKGPDDAELLMAVRAADAAVCDAAAHAAAAECAE